MKFKLYLTLLLVLIVNTLTITLQPLRAKTVETPNPSPYSILANVNGRNIFLTDLKLRIKTNNLFTASDNSNSKAFKALMLNQLVTENLILSDAKKYNIPVTAEDIQNEVKEIESINKWGLKTFNQKIKSAGLNQEEVKAYLYKQALIKTMIQQISAQYAVISTQEIDSKYYDLLDLNGKDKYLLKAIYISTSQSSLQQSQEEINSIYKKLQQKQSFNTLASRYTSSVFDRAHQGQIGWVYETQLNNETLAALNNLKKGQFTAPLKGSNGYYIYMLQDKQPIVYFDPGDLNTVEQVKGMLRQQLMAEKSKLAVDNYIKNLYNTAVITYNVKL